MLGVSSCGSLKLVLYLGVVFSLFVAYVRGDYIVRVSLHGYNNPTHTVVTRSDRCCDGQQNSNGACPDTKRCDNVFNFCLKQLNSSDVGTDTCSSPVRASRVNKDDRNIDFTQTTVLGLENPLLLQGISTAWEGAQIFVQVNDFDTTSSYDTVDIWRFNRSPTILPVGTISPQTAHPGVYGYATLTMSFEIVCVDNYDGEFCGNLNECLFQNISCGLQGDCVDGDGSASCVCNPGFTGSLCESDISECKGITCSGNGQCVDLINDFRCVCNPGYSGEVCQLDIDECVGVSCSGKGQCVDVVNGFECGCSLGYIGTLCEDIDDCVNVSCSGNGECVDGSNNFTCVCQSGFTGDLCSVDIKANTRLVAGIAGAVGGCLIIIFTILIVVIILHAIAYRKSSSNYNVSVTGNSNSTSTKLEMNQNVVYGVTQTSSPTQTTTDEIELQTNVLYGARETEVDSIDQAIYMNEDKGEDIYMNESKHQAIHMNKSKDQPIYMNTGKDQAIHANEGKDQPIYMNVGKNEDIHMNVGKDQPIHVNEGKDQPIYMDDGKDQPIYMNDGKDQPIHMNGNQDEDIYMNEGLGPRPAEGQFAEDECVYASI